MVVVWPRLAGSSGRHVVNSRAERHAAQAARDAGWTVTVWQAWHGGAMAVTMIYHRIMTATNKG